MSGKKELNVDLASNSEGKTVKDKSRCNSLKSGARTLQRSESLPKLDSYFNTADQDGVGDPFRRSSKITRTPPGPLEGDVSLFRKRLREGDDDLGEKKLREDKLWETLKEILTEIRDYRKGMASVKETLAHMKVEKEQEMEVFKEWKRNVNERLNKMERAMEIENKMDVLVDGKDDGKESTTNTKKIDGNVKSDLEVSILAEIGGRFDDMENRSRRGNIVLSGVKDCEDEKPEETAENVQRILKYTLELEDVEFIRLHRVVKFTKEKTRVIIGKLVDERMKIVLLRNKQKLRNLPGEKIFIDEDFSYKTRLARAKLRTFGMEKKKQEG